MDSREKGRRSEDRAASYLKAAGWDVVSRNYRTGSGEIDIIAMDGSTLVAVEVKSLPANWSVSDITSMVDRRKLGRIRGTLAVFCSAEGSSIPRPFETVRFDVICVKADGSVRHFQGVE